MADLDVGIGAFIRSNALEKITVMGRRVEGTGHGFSRFITRTKELPSFMFPQNHHSFSPVPGIPVFMSFLHVGRPEALFKNQLLLATFVIVLKEHILGIRELLIIIKKVFTSHRCNPNRMSFNTQSPPCNVEIVHAVVSHIATAELEEPPPTAREKI